MNLTRHLKSDGILLGINPQNQQQLYETMVRAIATSEFLLKNPGLTREDLLQAVFDREKERSTAMGKGIGMPHARVASLAIPGVAIATLATPLEVPGEAEPLKLVCMVVTPESRPTISLKIMATLLRFLNRGSNYDDFMNLASPSKAWKLLEAEDLPGDDPVLALDIMRAPGIRTSPDTPLKDVTRLMYEQHLDVLPVVNPENSDKLVGEISTDALFRFGIPDFFAKLQSVSFIAEFDPFERYFEVESGSCAKDVMNPACARIAPEHTLLEVVFDLAVKGLPQLYIIDRNNRWIGTIDRSTVLDNVLNF
ncbi:MAG: hypothetical protein CVV64_14575 [Candidatus Wallbacteria bacterium HGW-Wallbacteria-1]|jgi:mannitol/fructose-specific phosphotransferase system IIA component (Ntr-type)|uniref:CBS domain-containing protein n=1 Tax=Candidatus Wallbacteria bacterium HGW-Wallbacteria-1 TaxID=2013854 RepID=A0A2N1PM08_9BACT|nr:MAG: hypothetical protein CVV64_14575 [Candidatus Wallbacteria bacterium HGW-Wallbacteria-1]